MKNREIQQRLERAMNEVPIDLFKIIQETPIEKMEKHDSITEQKKNKIYPGFFKPLSLGVSFMLILVMGIAGWYQYSFAPDSYIYFDVNPGIEIVTNRQNQVLELVGSNDSGKNLVASIEYRKKDLEQVQNRILDKMMEEGILKDNRQVMLVSAFNKDKGKSKEVLEDFDKRLHKYFENQELNLVVLRQVLDKSSTLEEFSGTYNITMGKITFIRNLMILNSDFLLEDLVNLSLEELLTLSLQTGLKLDRIIESDDNYEKIPLPRTPIMEGLSMYEAEEIALRKIGGGTVIKMEYDSEDQEYEITIQDNEYEYEMTIDASTGRITEIDTEEIDEEERITGNQDMNHLIGINQVREIALSLVGGGIIENIELDKDEGRFIFEIELQYHGKKYELDIDAYTGELLSLK